MVQGQRNKQCAKMLIRKNYDVKSAKKQGSFLKSQKAKKIEKI